MSHLQGNAHNQQKPRLNLITQGFPDRPAYGTGVSEARDGWCSECHMKLRPQMFVDLKKNDEIVVRETGTLALTFDHRVVDGARAAAFGLAVIARIESSS